MIFIQITAQLKSLGNLLSLLSDQQYNQKISFLGNSSIGSHTRHIIELLNCALAGYDGGRVDYLNRVRNLAIETDKAVALQELNFAAVHIIRHDKPMQLLVESAGENDAYVNTTYFRELVYNAEHTIHHLALIKVALREMNLGLVADDFGVAYSTITFLASQTKTQN